MPIDLPAGIIIFLLTVALTFLLFINAAKDRVTTSIILIIWLALTGILSYKQVFQNSSAIPPRLMLVMAPAILFIILLLITKKGRGFTDSLNLKKLTLLHIVR